ncbi:transposase [Sorangium sp. KYC3313]|uniref:transposase n=1 Tax=Sorangium sp. KYC3313 TaxID=3449740 RepID=UPI003F8BB800
MERIFAEEIARVTTRLASIAGARTGSVGFPQRFGSSLNVHVHFHTLSIDGVFEKTAAVNRRRFREDRRWQSTAFSRRPPWACASTMHRRLQRTMPARWRDGCRGARASSRRARAVHRAVTSKH